MPVSLPKVPKHSNCHSKAVYLYGHDRSEWCPSKRYKEIQEVQETLQNA